MEIVRYFSLLCVAAAGALLMSGLVIRIGQRYGLYADPRKLRFFRKQIVALGGVPLFVGFSLVALYALASVPQGADDIYSRSSMVKMIWGIFWGGLLLLGWGLYNLKRPQCAWMAWLMLFVAVGIAFLHQVQIEALGVLHWKVIDLNHLSFPVTLLWFLLVVAIFEILDSVDGLANVGLVLGSGLGFVLVDFSREVYVPFLYTALAGSSLGCLWTNNFRPRVVYGPTGNKLIGFLFAAVILVARQKETVVQVMIFPVVLIALVVIFFVMTYFESRRATATLESPSSNRKTPGQ